LAGAFALFADFHVAAFSARPPALIAVDLALHIKFGVCSNVQFLKRGLNRQFVGWTFLPAIPTLFVAFNLIFTLLVIYLSLGGITQYIVGTSNLSELRRRLLIAWILIWVMLEGHLLISAFEGRLIDIGLHAEYFVQVSANDNLHDHADHD